MSIYRVAAYLILSTAIVLFVVIPSLLMGLIYTAPGSQWLVNTAQRWLPETVSFTRFEGRLADHFTFDQFTFNSDTFSAEFERVELTWQPWLLLDSTLRVNQLELSDGTIRVRQTQQTGADDSPSSIESFSLSLPFAVELQQLKLNESWVFINELPQQQLGAELSLKLSERGELGLRSLQLTHQYASFSASAEANLSFPFKHNLQAALQLHSPDYPKTHLELDSRGDIDNLEGTFNASESVNIEGTVKLTDALSEPNWTSTVSIQQTSMNDWLVALGISGLEPLSLDGKVTLSGKPGQAISAVPDMTVIYAQRQAQLTGNTSLDNNKLNLDALTLRSDEHGQVALNGVVETSPSVSVDIMTELDDVSYQQTQTRGSITLQGPLEKLRISSVTQTQIEQPQTATIEARLQAVLESNQLMLQQLQISDSVTNGEITGTADVTWGDQIQVTADINGELLSRPFSLMTDLKYNAPYVDVSMVELDWRMAQVSAKGRLSPGSQLLIEVDVPSLAKLPIPADLEGDVSLEGQIEGDISSLWLDMNVTSQRLAIAGTEFNNLALKLNGAPNKHDLTVSLNAFATDWQLKSRNTFSQQSAAIDLLDWQLDHESLPPFKLSQAAQINYSADNNNLVIDKLCLRQENDEGLFCIEADTESNITSVKSRLNAINMNLINPFLANAPIAIDGLLDADAGADWDWQSNQLTTLGLEAAVDQLKLSGLEESVTFERFAVRFAPVADKFEARLDARADEIGFTAEGRVDVANLRPSSAISGTMTTRLDDLGMVEILSPQIGSADGRLSANIALSGTASDIRLKPRIDGRIDELVIAETATAISDTTISLSATDASNDNFRLTANGMIGKGNFELAGNFDIAAQQLQAQLKGEQLQLIDTPKLAVTVSPDIEVALADNKLAVTGDVLVPRANITPPQLSNVQRPSSDVVITQQQRPKERALQTSADITLTLGEQVNVDAYGFQGQLQGQLNIKQSNTGVARGNGEIGVKTGTYEVYGQELTIERGQLVYNGGPIANPSLNLQVVRNLPKTTGNPERVGARVQGTLQEPTLDLFSNPSMPDASILSYLMFGRAPNSPSESSNLELQAALLLTGDMANSFTQSLKDTFGFDEVAIDSASSDVNDTSLYIGKYLTPRLYIKYGIGLVESTSSFFLRYQLTDHLWIESTSSTESQGGDLIYSIEK